VEVDWTFGRVAMQNASYERPSKCKFQ